MVGKIIRTKHVPLEERPEFIELRDSLPGDHAQLGQVLLDCRAELNDAVLSGHVDRIPEISLRFNAALHRMNGGGLGCFACDSEPVLFLAQHDPAPGQVPKWGEAGEFLLEVEGVRIRVEIGRYSMDWAQTGALHAIDLDKPFVSSTGYQSLWIVPSECAGLTVDQAVRRAVLVILDEKPKKKRLEMIDGEHRERRHLFRPNPRWLVDALAGVTRDGQLTLFGEQEEKKAPMSAAERQRRHREKMKREREEGRRCDLSLSANDVALVRAALKACSGRADVAGLLGRLPEVAVDEPDLHGPALPAVTDSVPAPAPAGEGERDYRLTEHQVALLLVCIDSHLTIRSDLASIETPDFRELVDLLSRGSRFEGIEKTMGKSRGILAILERLEDQAKRGWKAYNEERECQRSRGEQAEAIAAQRREAELGPLQRELEALRREKALLEAERNGAFAANKVLEQRLRDAGLSTDYR